MASVYKLQNKAEYIAMRDCFLRYNPTLKDLNRSAKQAMLDMAMLGNIRTETLLEQTIALCGNLERSNKPGEDFTDNSDAKWFTIFFAKNGSTYAHTGSIKNLKNKTGALRIAGYIDDLEEICYYYVPYSEWIKMTNTEGDRIRISYNSYDRRVNKLSDFMVDWNSFCSTPTNKKFKNISPKKDFSLESFFS